MAYRTGLRVLAAFLCLTGVGIPLGLYLLWKAQKEEARTEERREAQTDVD